MTFKNFFLFVSLSALLHSNQGLEFINNSTFQNIQMRKFKLFTHWLSCEERGAVLFNYKTVPDTGNLSRLSSFRFDPGFPKQCQQKSTNAYGSLYDRGHLVPANHLDHDSVAIAQSNYMTNILPQYGQLNRGAWLVTEEITECYRDLYDLEVIGGIIMGNDAENDIFLQSHGIRTPDWFWKIIRNLQTNKIIAWIMPNDATAIRSAVDKYLVSVAEIEEKSGFYFSKLSEKQRRSIETVTWSLPKSCDLSK